MTNGVAVLRVTSFGAADVAVRGVSTFFKFLSNSDWSKALNLTIGAAVVTEVVVLATVGRFRTRRVEVLYVVAVVGIVDTAAVVVDGGWVVVVSKGIVVVSLTTSGLPSSLK